MRLDRYIRIGYVGFEVKSLYFILWLEMIWGFLSKEVIRFD